MLIVNTLSSKLQSDNNLLAVELNTFIFYI